MTHSNAATASALGQPAVEGQSVALPRSLSTFRLAVFVIAAVAPLAVHAERLQRVDDQFLELGRGTHKSTPVCVSATSQIQLRSDKASTSIRS